MPSPILIGIGNPVPDVNVLEFKREKLRDCFDDLYRLLNREAVIRARKDKLARLGPM